MLNEGLRGSDGAGSNQLLSLAGNTLAEAESGCLAGFLRPGALLHVLVISGQSDGSHQSIDTQLSNIWSHAPNALDVMISAIVATEEDGCQGAHYGQGYTDAAISTGGEIGDLCAASWETVLENVAWRSGRRAEGGLSVTLGQAPVSETINVKIDGMTWTDWTYSAPDNAVRFSETNAPVAGSYVEIFYLQAQECSQ